MNNPLIIDNIDYTDRPQDLPDGCIVSFKFQGHWYYGIKKGEQFKRCSYGGAIYIKACYDIRIHDIMDEHGNSTHQKMWFGCGNCRDMWGVFYDRGLRNIRHNVSEIKKLKQLWKDEPMEVWVKL